MIYHGVRRIRDGLAMSIMLLALPLPAEAAKWKLHTLYSFCSTANEDCSLGLPDPTGAVVVDKKGNVYGTTQHGGLNNAGEVFKVTPKGKETVLYSFCSLPNCGDGETPIAGLIRDAAGNLYGTTQVGGSVASTPAPSGTVFRVAPDGAETVLYTFGQLQDRADGGFPSGGVVMDGFGGLLGEADKAGANNGGVIFDLANGTLRVLWNFCAEANCTDGNQPMAPPIANPVFPGEARSSSVSFHSFFGTTYSGGASNQGTVYQVNVGVLGGGNAETALYSFCSATNCTDGQNPAAGLIVDANGNMYGTATGGGSHGNGVVFEVTATLQYQELHSFRGSPADGALPNGGLVIETAGNLYGTTTTGGASNQGAVFEITAAGREQVIYSFCDASGCPDGSQPVGGLAIDKHGNLYGTTTEGGSAGGGTVFELRRSR